jgi:hypothetical protein
MFHDACALEVFTGRHLTILPDLTKPEPEVYLEIFTRTRPKVNFLSFQPDIFKIGPGSVIYLKVNFGSG